MDIEKLSEEELADLGKKVEERLSKVRSRPPRSEMLKAIEQIATQNGYTMAELFPTAASAAKAGPKKLGKAKVKYIHPENSELRWSGRGSKPRWVVEWLAVGKRLEDLTLSVADGQSGGR